ncbi:MBL fold metallo-hydrolase [Oceanimonas sp. NS1]|nr:MBL fold metallo-hydrolase [Oceanimonas sp. NS1]
MELVFLGTSSGVPTRGRSLSAVALRRHKAKTWLLVDCGEGTQHRLLRAPLSLHWLQAVCITHLHGDHCYGLPGLLASAGLNGRTAPLTIIGPAGLQAWVEHTAAVSQLQLNYALRFVSVEELAAGVARWRWSSLRSPPPRCRTGCPALAMPSPKPACPAGSTPPG